MLASLLENAPNLELLIFLSSSKLQRVFNIMELIPDSAVPKL